MSAASAKMFNLGFHCSSCPRSPISLSISRAIRSFSFSFPFSSSTASSSTASSSTASSSAGLLKNIHLCHAVRTDDPLFYRFSCNSGGRNAFYSVRRVRVFHRYLHRAGFTQRNAAETALRSRFPLFTNSANAANAANLSHLFYKSFKK